MATNTAVSLPWYRSLSREQWGVLIASNLGWLFDGFELYALFLTVGFALHQLLDAAHTHPFPATPAISSPPPSSAGPPAGSLAA